MTQMAIHQGKQRYISIVSHRRCHISVSFLVKSVHWWLLVNNTHAIGSEYLDTTENLEQGVKLGYFSYPQNSLPVLTLAEANRRESRLI